MDNFCPYFCQNFNLIIFLEGDWDDYFEPVNSRQDSDNFRDRSRGGRGGAPRFKRGGGPGYGRQVGQIDTVGKNIIATIEVRNFYPLKMLIFKYCDINIRLFLLLPI